MSQPKIVIRKHLNADSLFHQIHTEFEKIPDLCDREVEISVADALTSGFAMFSLKDPSLLAFDQRRYDETKLNNLKTLYHIGVVPCDTQMRVILDQVETEELTPVFTEISRQAQRGKVLEKLVFLDNCYLLSLDGTQYFSSKKIHCPSCLTKTNANTGEVTYSHQMLGAAIVHPDCREVLPVCPEPIKKQDGETKNDCERAAAKRFLEQFRRVHPHLGVIVTEDGLSSNAPHIRELFRHNMHFIFDEPEYGTDFRTSHVNLDPTFPQKPLKIQLVTECFLPEIQEKIQTWITQERDNYLEPYYQLPSSSLFMDSSHEWVLLYALLEQQNDNGARMYAEAGTLLVHNTWLDPFIESPRLQAFSLRDIPEYLYLFASEIPWSRNITQEVDVMEIQGQDVEIYFPFLFYFWESTRSQINDIGYIPFVAPAIADELKLRYNVRDVSYYTPIGEPATKFLWDDYSRYLYIRKDLLMTFTKKHDLSLIWLERGSRYGDYGNMQTKLKPSLKDFGSIRTLSQDAL